MLVNFVYIIFVPMRVFAERQYAPVLVWYWLLNISGHLGIGYFLKLSYRLGLDLGSKTDFWLVWGKYILGGDWYKIWHYERMWFSHTKKLWLMIHVWGKLCGFIHYNVQYVMFIVAYITLNWQIDIRILHVEMSN